MVFALRYTRHDTKIKIDPAGDSSPSFQPNDSSLPPVLVDRSLRHCELIAFDLDQARAFTVTPCSTNLTKAVTTFFGMRIVA